MHDEHVVTPPDVVQLAQLGCLHYAVHVTVPSACLFGWNVGLHTMQPPDKLHD
jgi:hypothetical protein